MEPLVINPPECAWQSMWKSKPKKWFCTTCRGWWRKKSNEEPDGCLCERIVINWPAPSEQS